MRRRTGRIQGEREFGVKYKSPHDTCGTEQTSMLAQHGLAVYVSGVGAQSPSAASTDAIGDDTGNKQLRDLLPARINQSGPNNFVSDERTAESFGEGRDELRWRG